MKTVKIVYENKKYLMFASNIGCIIEVEYKKDK